ncbi:aspartic peptidase domain-containing protein [Podospora fimiseda]|uniref:Aspartic peptidase domain-containing protein n=1 Tax=Podospora fimiseda TaxID=252190 RepID=A0AAN6YQP6_9PEZI|nr:aspartic peptidase domain-containing protein [Podospora fimiseda]
MNFIFFSAVIMLQVAAAAIINPLTGAKRLRPAQKVTQSHSEEVIDPISGSHRHGFDKRDSQGSGVIINPISASARLGPDPSPQLSKRDSSSHRPLTLPLTSWTPNLTTLQWSAEIFVGTPPQKFHIILDTGNPFPLLLPSPLITFPPFSPQHHKFYPSLSTKFFSLPNSTLVPLGFGQTGGRTVPYSTPQGANCTPVSDTLTIAGRQIPNQQFLLCDYYSEGLIEQFADGLMGLASVPTGKWPNLEGGYESILKGLGVNEVMIDLDGGKVKFGTDSGKKGE